MLSTNITHESVLCKDVQEITRGTHLLHTRHKRDQAVAWVGAELEDDKLSCIRLHMPQHTQQAAKGWRQLALHKEWIFKQHKQC